MERQIWRLHPYTAFTMFDKFFNMFTLLLGPITITYFLITREQNLTAGIIIASYIVYLMLTRFIKYGPHFIRRPIDVWFLPVVLLFNFYFAFQKIYCLCTLHITDWGTRAGADDAAHEMKQKSDVLPDEEKGLSGISQPPHVYGGDGVVRNGSILKKESTMTLVEKQDLSEASGSAQLFRHVSFKRPRV
jgi:hypothetical protein